MNELEQRIKDFGVFVDIEIQRNHKGKYVAWHFTKMDGVLKAEIYILANNTDKETIEEYKKRGWIVNEKNDVKAIL